MEEHGGRDSEGGGHEVWQESVGSCGLVAESQVRQAMQGVSRGCKGRSALQEAGGTRQWESVVNAKCILSPSQK